MSLQRDTIDSFWFILRHEIEHVLQRDGQDDEVIDEDLAANAILPEEIAANRAAADFCVPRQELDSFLARKRPYYYEKDVVAFAKLHQRHPGLIVGQMQKRTERWDYLARYLVKIRQFVLPAAVADGWGQTIRAES
jgi:HTH-type transcriptional regulator/antitoxin HigA